MTAREHKLCKRLLDVLHEEDGRQVDDLLLHARVNESAACSLSEFAGALAMCDTRGWITGITSRYVSGRKLWNINDAGEAARLEL